MNRADTLALLTQHKPELQRRFGVVRLALFGSRKVFDYTRGLDRASFASDEMRYDATLRNLELIGEAATHVPNDIRVSATDVPWRPIVAVRNRLIHGYLGMRP